MRRVAPRLCVLVLLVQICVAEGAEPGAPAAPPRPASPASVTGAIPVAEVATRATQVPEFLRTSTEPDALRQGIS
jgi:hypothetical protein